MPAGRAGLRAGVKKAPSEKIARHDIARVSVLNFSHFRAGHATECA